MKILQIKTEPFFFLLSLLLLPHTSFAGSTVVANDDNYEVLKSKDFQFIYDKELKFELEKTKYLSQQIQNLYQNSFQHRLDEPLRIGLLSKNNQVANGFSTPTPFNMQMNYLGGTQSIDYFSSSSWLDALLYHETAHNYQLNPKNNPVSCAVKQVFGNNGYPLFVSIIPFFTFPNMTLPTALIEGNAVLNESWHGNGGRLYSGRAYALLLSLLKANKLDATRFINSHLDFPYNEEKYLVGGFFWLWLSETYGLEKSNQFFVHASQHFLNPFQTNKTFMQHFGINFEQAVEQFIQHHTKSAQQFTKLEGEQIARSQNFAFMNKNNSEILLLTNDKKESSKLHRIALNNHSHSIETGRWPTGKPFIYQDKAVTAASHVNGPEHIVQGLFDKEGNLQKNTDSKMLQSLSKQQALWFDVERSFYKAQLVQGNTKLEKGNFVDEINSSAFLDTKGNMLYFKQKGKTRSLYINQQKQFSFQGYYSFIVDSDDSGSIYFIAPSQFGSSLYSWNGEKIKRLSNADNIIDAKLITEDANTQQQTWLAAAIDHDAIHYLKFKPSKKEAKHTSPFEITHWFEIEGPQLFKKSPKQAQKQWCQQATKDNLTEEKQSLSQDYSLWSQTRFSRLTPYFNYNSEQGLSFDFRLYFNDPLGQNALQLYLSRNENQDYLTGLDYQNTLYRLEYGGGIYGIKRAEQLEGSRDYGFHAFTKYQLLQQGYHQANTKINATADDEFKDKNFYTLSLNYSYLYQKSLQLYANEHRHLSSFAKYDRGDKFLGAQGRWSGLLGYDFYLGFNAKYVDSSTENLTEARGIRFSNKTSHPAADMSDFHIAGLEQQFFARKGWSAGGDIKKQLNGSLYFFTFPISLRRESIYLSHHRYKAYDNNDRSSEFNESIAGLNLDLLILNKFPLPFSFEIIHNDNVNNEISYRVKVDFWN